MSPDAPSADSVPTLIFAGGGSGGHIYPALAIAERVRALSPGRVRCVFACSERPLDEKILAGAGAEFVRSPARPVSLKPKGLLAFVRSWPRAVRQARALIRESRGGSPVHLVAMGGFVAAPFAAAAVKERCPATMVNLDAVPGKANRWIAPRVGHVYSALVVDARFRGRISTPWTDVPPIVRDGARARATKEEARTALGLDPTRPVLMTTGGSQGLRSINDFVTAFAASDQGRQALTEGRWQVLHQTGRNLASAVQAKYAGAGIDARVVDFTDQMGLWWAASDLAVCTAGAGNVAEIWASSTPALLLPYPHHRDQHQKYNALALERVGGVVVGIDRIDAPANLAQNAATLAELLTRADKRAAMRAALASLGLADGAERIARALLDALSGAGAGIS